MSGGRYETQLCTVLVAEQFGQAVADVAEKLLKEDCQLPSLAFKLRPTYNMAMIRKALAVLINFGFVTFVLDTNKRPVYTAHGDQILRLLTVPRFCLLVKTLYGSVAEDVCVELFSEGQLTCSDVLRRVFSRNDTLTIEELKKTFCDLTQAQFIIRSPAISGVSNGCPQLEHVQAPFNMPDSIFQVNNGPGEEKGRKRKSAKDEDDGIYWRVNWARFDVYARDEMITEFLITNTTVGRKMPDICIKTIQALFKTIELRASSLRMTATSPVSMLDMVKSAKENALTLEKADMAYVLGEFADETKGLVRKAGDSGGGLFVVDIEKTLTEICKHHSESLVREQFEGRAVRIMRLMEERHFLDEEQVEKLLMMGAKETKELLYALLEEGFIFTRPIGRTNDFQPARTFYLYHVDLQRTVRSLIECTCKLLRNLILRNAHERRENKQLIEKDLTTGPIIEGIRANEELDEASKKAQIEEVEEMYLPGHDRAKLERYRRSRSTLLAAQEKASQALFAFRLFLDVSVPQKA
ncbi:unnamed protein product [Caenorhabditis auriculariae]|uniref:DNA-directed RNA polymerase III subunit RPC3 n=1 Tax=Caenorhabditis auriculariae TaxID=2777116 RepID=A0A8S1HTE4_9PELO|nr:unnamed protein product [Caenorhabditis auriculariae]